MKIDLNKDWRITTDSHNYILEKKAIVQKGENAGKEVYKSVAFYPNLDWCIRDLLRREISGKDIQRVKEIKEHLNKVEESILRGLNNVK